jgi:hypothetical protein
LVGQSEAKIRFRQSQHSFLFQSNARIYHCTIFDATPAHAYCVLPALTKITMPKEFEGDTFGQLIEQYQNELRLWRMTDINESQRQCSPSRFGVALDVMPARCHANRFTTVTYR